MSNAQYTMDILTIDRKIAEMFDEEYALLEVYKTRLEDVEDSLGKMSYANIHKSMLEAKDDLEHNISEIKSRKKYNFYTMETLPILEEYKDVLNSPITVSFTGKKSRKSDKKIENLVQQYLSVAKKYVDNKHYASIFKDTQQEKQDEIQCHNCPNRKDFDILDKNTYVCMKCYAEQIVIRHTSSYNDIDRVNISNKYMYERKVHFGECINQYQGKQNSTVPQKVYDDLENEFRKHHLLEESDTREGMFKNITKQHIQIFLKDLQYPSHYENIHLIHYNLTGIKPDDISHLEDQLMDDFDTLTDLYDKRYKSGNEDMEDSTKLYHKQIANRKNFINTQYVLYQLLQHHRHPCKKEEFIILKTIDRKYFHDDICRSLFETLNWNHSPFF